MSKIESNSFFQWVARNKLLEKFFLKFISRKEGGEQISTTLREFYNYKYKVNVDLYSYGCFRPEFNCGGKGIKVGRYCSIAPNVRFYGANHPQENFSLSPYFYNKSFGLDVEDVDRKELTIGNDVWIGYGVIITAGCKKIGDGSVIGAGAVVTHNVEPYTIVGGNPARLIKRRFPEDITLQLLDSKWWELPPSTLHEFSEKKDIVAFLSWLADKRLHE